MIRFAVIAILLVTGFVAESSLAAPKNSLRPVARLQTDAQNNEVIVQASFETHLQVAASAAVGTVRSLRPSPRPDAVMTKAMARKRNRLKGAICGDRDLQGEAIGRVPGKLNGCGVQDAVRVRSVAGINLSQSSVMDCDTAKALKKWVNNGAKPAVGSKGGGLSCLKVAEHYSCRTRNNQAGARISEHGIGRAIDISGLILNDGRTISVLKGWNNADRRTMRKAHKKACGPFGTVLGPNADRFHLDHFHFDTARHRG